jgi:acetyltransferase-like isoleucine patch superfamily enzyme/acyl carrier protein
VNFAALLRRFTTPLAGVDQVGSGALLQGRPWIKNEGRLRIGQDFSMSSTPAVSHLVTWPGGSLTIGDRVAISYGAAISVAASLDIGDDTRIGPYSVVMDSDYHNVDDRSAAAETTPIVIGRGVSIGSRVTVLRGTTIGDGARILAGSVVSGLVPAGAVFGGVPARAVGASTARSSDGQVDLRELVKRVLGMQRSPEETDGPDTIPEWDSLGTLKLLLAIEEAHALTLPEEEMRSARSLTALAEVITRAVARSRAQSPNFATNLTYEA